MSTDLSTDQQLHVGTHAFSSRLIVGTGKYGSYDLMAEALEHFGQDEPNRRLVVRNQDLHTGGRISHRLGSWGRSRSREDRTRSDEKVDESEDRRLHVCPLPGLN